MLLGLLHAGITSVPAGAFGVTVESEEAGGQRIAFRFGAPWHRDASYLHMRIGAGLSDTGCWLYYHPASHTLWRYDPPAAQGPLEPGQSGELTARACAVDTGRSSVTASDDELVVTLSLRSSTGLPAAAKFYLQAHNDAARTGWEEALHTVAPLPRNPLRTGRERVYAVENAWAAIADQPRSPNAPAFVSLTPNSGQGGGQRFDIRFTSAKGVKRIHFLMNSSFSGLNACWFFIEGRSAWLYNDSVTAVKQVVHGEPGSASNSQCAISGYDHGFGWPREHHVGFFPSFAGPKKIYLLAEDGNGSSTGWIEAGSWTVTSTGYPLLVAREPVFSPQTGSPIMLIKLLHTAGYQNLAFAHLLLNNGLRGENGCWVFYHQPTESMWLYNDAATGVLGPVYPGAYGATENSRCQLSGIESSVTAQGTDMTVAFQVRFKSAGNSWGGAIYPHYWLDDAAASSGWMWTYSRYIPRIPAQVLSGGPSTGAGTGGTVSATLRDATSAAHLLIQAGHFGPNACWVVYEAATGKLNLINDDVTAWAGTVTPGQAGTAENSQCVLQGPGSSILRSGDQLTINANLTFKPSFAGVKQIKAYGSGANGNSGWVVVGQWTVP